MNILNNPNFKTMNVLKIGAVILIALVAVVIFFRIIASSIDSMSGGTKGGVIAERNSGLESRKMLLDKSEGSMPEMSLRNVAQNDSVVAQGDRDLNSEEMEVREYSATVETRNIKEDCAKIGI